MILIKLNGYTYVSIHLLLRLYVDVFLCNILECRVPQAKIKRKTVKLLISCQVWALIYFKDIRAPTNINSKQHVFFAVCYDIFNTTTDYVLYYTFNTFLALILSMFSRNRFPRAIVTKLYLIYGNFNFVFFLHSNIICRL